MGVADLGAAPVLAAGSAPLPGAFAPAMADTMVNCRELLPGALNLYWVVSESDV
jgi:hypothetical protein